MASPLSIDAHKEHGTPLGHQRTHFILVPQPDLHLWLCATRPSLSRIVQHPDQQMLPRDSTATAQSPLPLIDARVLTDARVLRSNRLACIRT